MTPISVTIAFDARNQLVINQIDRSLNTFVTTLNRVSAVSRTSGAAMRALTNEVVRLQTALRGGLLSGINVLEGRFNRLLDVTTRLARTGFYTLSAAAIAASYSFVQLGKSFLTINEQFKGLEITLKSAYNSLTVAKQLRAELVKITSGSPLPFAQLADVFRSSAVIPFTRGRIANDSTTGDQTTIKALVRLVEQMVVFRPDKTAEDAIFAIREALTGEFRSLIRRFDIPSSALAAASGKSGKELKNDPAATFEAMQRFFGNIISSSAIREYTRQPTILTQNIVEQIKNIPLLFVGDAGLYGKITKSLGQFLDQLVRFVSEEVEPYTIRISKAITASFDNLSGSGGRVLNSILGRAGLSASQRPDLSVYQRVAEGVTRSIEYIAREFPPLVEKALNFLSALVPPLLKVGEIFLKIANYWTSAFSKSPIGTLIGTALITQLPAAFIGIGKMLSSRVAEAVGRGFVQGIHTNTINQMTAAGSVMPSGFRAGGAGASAGAFSNLGAKITQDSLGRYRLMPGALATLSAGDRALLGLSATGGSTMIRTPIAQGILGRTPGSAGAGFAGAAGALGGITASIAVFASAVAIFAGAAYAFDSIKSHFYEKNRADDAPWVRDSESKLSAFNIHRTLLQASSDLPLIEKAIRQENAASGFTLRSGIGTPSRGSSLSALVPSISGIPFKKVLDDTTSAASDWEGLNQLLKQKTGEFTTSSGTSFSIGGLSPGADRTKIMSEIAKLAENTKTGIVLLEKLRTVGLKGISNTFRPEFKTVLTESEQTTVSNLIEEAETFQDRSNVFNGWYKGSLDMLNTQVEGLSSINGYIEKLNPFFAAVKDKYDPAFEAKDSIGSIKTLIPSILSSQKLFSNIERDGFNSDSKGLMGNVIELYQRMNSVPDHMKPAIQKQLDTMRKLIGDLDSGAYDKAAWADLSDKFMTARNNFTAAIAGESLKALEHISASIAQSGSAYGAGLIADSGSFLNSGLLSGVPNATALLKSLRLNPNESGNTATFDKLAASRNAVTLAGGAYGNLQRTLPVEGNLEQWQKTIEAAKKAYLAAKSANDELLYSFTEGGAIKSFTKGFTEVTKMWELTATNLREIGNKSAEALSSGFGEAFEKIAFESQDAGKAFQEFGRSVLKTVSMMFVNKAFQAIFGYVLGAVTGTGIGPTIGAAAGSFAAGGVNTSSKGNATQDFSNSMQYSPSRSKRMVDNGVSIHISVDNRGNETTSQKGGGKGAGGPDMNKLGKQIKALVQSEFQEAKRNSGALSRYQNRGGR